MKFSENWLRSFVNPALDSKQLADALTMAGLEVEALEDAGPDSDKVFTLKLTPNRGDCMSVAGIAREVAAITKTNLAGQKTAAIPAETQDQLKVTVAAPEACPLYCGRIVRGIRTLVSTPGWMARRLECSGLRSVNPMVDITNYVMLETGQPLHAFDLARISGAITVRFARSGEGLTLLNGQGAELDPDMLVIADEGRALALAGIMGGADSAVTENTAELFLESAFFSPGVIAGKARRLGFATDSSHRFERGVDFAATREALERATQLIVEICGGKAGPVIEVRGQLPARNPIRLRAERTRRVLGLALDEAQIGELLKRLRFSFAAEQGVFLVTPPSHRFDLMIEEDLIEELARLYGYGNIPTNQPRTEFAMLPNQETVRDLSRVRQILVARDYQEAVTYAFVNSQWEEDFCGNANPVKLKNPIASQMNVMRSSLAGGLIDCLRFNLNHKHSRVRLAEIGCCFERNAEGYSQAEKLGGLCYGEIMAEQWSAPSRDVDFFDVKADIEALFWPMQVEFDASPHPALHPGRSARIRLGDAIAGWVGELHPRWQQKYELPKPAVLFEIEIENLARRRLPAAGEISKFPPVRRDIAVVVDEKLPAQSLLDSLRAGRAPFIAEISLFDLYRGEGLGPGKKSLAFRVLLQDTKRTLTDAEIDTAIAQLVRILEVQYQAKLRV